jgi:hypothetical protein
MERRWRRPTLTIAAVVGVSVALGAPVITGASHETAASGPPRGVTTYGQTLWNLEALLHDTFGNKPTCVRWRDYAFVSATCADLVNFGYWKYMFVSARHSRFKLVRRTFPPITGGNVVPVKVKGSYVYCGSFPAAFALVGGEGSPKRRWLVVLHGWVLEPFTCLG